VLFCDIEATDQRPLEDHVTELAAVRLTTGESYSQLVRPGKPILPLVQKKTGITDARVATEGIAPVTALQGFCDFVEASGTGQVCTRMSPASNTMSENSGLPQRA
jgi:DNA polymerase III epsilon subunit-like protein